MGQHQIMLVILGVIVIGIAVSVAIAHFGAQSVDANKSGVTATLTTISADAYQYKLRPGTLGGGGNSYTGYAVPRKFRSDEYGMRYETSLASNGSCKIIGISIADSGWVATCTVDDTGRTSFTYAGW